MSGVQAVQLLGQVGLIQQDMAAVRTDMYYLIFMVVVLCGIILGCFFWQGD